MAKKVKPKKSGMVKRQEQKRTKKAQYRRLTASRAPKQINSMKEAHKALAKLPTLAFSPELEDIQLDSQAIKESLDAGKSDPVILAELFAPELIAEIQRRVTVIEDDSAPQSPQNILAKATLYALESQSEIPVFANPLLIAIYLRSRATALGETMEVSEIIGAVDGYERNYSELMAEMTNPDAHAHDHEHLETEYDEPSVVVSEKKEQFISKEILDQYFESLGEYPQDQQDRMQEDVEVFLDDYIQSPPEEWGTEMVEDFLGSWVPQNLNPMEDDLLSMQRTLNHFFEYLVKETLLSAESADKMFPLLKDEETYKRRLAAR